MEKLAVGIIPDGSRKWAQRVGTPLGGAYAHGARVAVEVLQAALAQGDIGRIVFYVLSHENFQRRPPEQVRAILVGIETFLERVCDIPGVHVHCHGDHRPPEVVRLARWCPVGAVSISNGGVRVDLLLHYSAAWDLETRPVRTASIPPLDAIIRTSGATRLSGFLPWQSSYAQFYFSETLWPEFTAAEFEKVMAAYREFRRHGPTGA